MEKFERKKKNLSSWKRNNLSLGGKITLINATFSNLPVYYVSRFKMLIAMKERLDQIHLHFLWEGHNPIRKLLLLKWCDVIKLFQQVVWLTNLELKNWGDSYEMVVEIWRGERCSVEQDCGFQIW